MVQALQSFIHLRGFKTIFLSERLLSTLHFGVIVFAVVSPFILPLSAVLFLVFAHRVQFIACDGCLLSQLQQRLGHFSHDTCYFQHLFKKFGVSISRQHAWCIDKGLNIFVVTFSLGLYVM